MVSAVLEIGEAVTQVKKSQCPKRIEIFGHPMFKLQKDGSYKNDFGNQILQNDEDRAWFISGLTKGKDQLSVLLTDVVEVIC